jgi:2EXR family
MTEEPRFALFRDLPTEIRLSIWRIALANELERPRFVEVRTQKHDNCGMHQGWCPRVSPSSNPALMYVCREAREEALKSNKLYFGSDLYPARIFFNPAIDTLYLPEDIWNSDTNGIITQLRMDHGTDTIRYLAGDLEAWMDHFSSLFESDLSHFNNLEDIIMVIDEESDEYRSKFSIMDKLLSSYIAQNAYRTRKYREGRSLHAPRLRVHPKNCKLMLKKNIS